MKSWLLLAVLTAGLGWTASAAQAAILIRGQRQAREMERFCADAATRIENRFVRGIYDRCMASKGFGKYEPEEQNGLLRSGTRLRFGGGTRF